MQCRFDENEVEYHSCERPMCNHTECDKHEEYMRVDLNVSDEKCPFTEDELALLDAE